MVDFQCKSRYDWADFLQVMALLRAPGGCPWDRAQTHHTLRQYMIEEACEAAEALVRDCKDFLATPEGERARSLPGFCVRVTERIGALEALLPVE